MNTWIKRLCNCAINDFYGGCHLLEVIKLLYLSLHRRHKDSSTGLQVSPCLDHESWPIRKCAKEGKRIHTVLAQICCYFIRSFIDIRFCPYYPDVFTSVSIRFKWLLIQILRMDKILLICISTTSHLSLVCVLQFNLSFTLCIKTIHVIVHCDIRNVIIWHSIRIGWKSTPAVVTFSVTQQTRKVSLINQ